MESAWLFGIGFQMRMGSEEALLIFDHFGFRLLSSGNSAASQNQSEKLILVLGI
jgi:hypothetical protein